MRNKNIGAIGRFFGGRFLFLLMGHVSLLIGLIGLLVPIMPTSPFVIIAAACYARSSERFYLLLLNNKYFGEDIARWLEHRCVRKQVKMVSATMLAIAFSFTLLFFVTLPWLHFVVGGVGLLAVLTVLSIPACKE